MGLEIEVASRKEFKKDLGRIWKWIKIFFMWDAPKRVNRHPFGINPAKFQEVKSNLINLVLACLEIPSEMVEKSVAKGTLAAIILYPLAYYSFLAWLSVILLEILFKFVDFIAKDRD
ncbi:hypothetical protein A2V61_00365 [Candidatus Woesebacteria bacterium RBG_19FT_COMBO_47_8]|uniref:Uncharacterized protein n=1 Tax=Candidatus Woesebacteria bacterium RBG_13_46_13 TaxID=1802479 RepID=A0A1F7X5D8_9BACT|nr:MAG: hypothetical protein A2Y68_03045 [Candidatus Woesebacteria bacterium RBG_13_46_13]OGM18153.1 MAG: hypothetical protein A2V61_00365 [Candidatus Woesebacteria bacterium RBG_19FT_COMBO_47_8]HJX59537.1 hypothetical protein [Patescibacteria group bacterium]